MRAAVTSRTLSILLGPLPERRSEPLAFRFLCHPCRRRRIEGRRRRALTRCAPTAPHGVRYPISSPSQAHVAARHQGRRFSPPLSAAKGCFLASGRETRNAISLNLLDFSVFSSVHRISVKKLSFAAGHRRTRCYNPARFRGTNKRPEGSARSRCPKRQDARIAQLVEQRIENPRVGGSNPPPGTILLLKDLVS